MCKQCYNVAKKIFPNFPAKEISFVLWNATCFPFGKPKDVKAQLNKLKELSGGHLELVRTLTDELEDADYQKMTQDRAWSLEKKLYDLVKNKKIDQIVDEAKDIDSLKEMISFLRATVSVKKQLKIIRSKMLEKLKKIQNFNLKSEQKRMSTFLKAVK